MAAEQSYSKSAKHKLKFGGNDHKELSKHHDVTTHTPCCSLKSSVCGLASSESNKSTCPKLKSCFVEKQESKCCILKQRKSEQKKTRGKEEVKKEVEKVPTVPPSNNNEELSKAKKRRLRKKKVLAIYSSIKVEQAPPKVNLIKPDPIVKPSPQPQVKEVKTEIPKIVTKELRKRAEKTVLEARKKKIITKSPPQDTQIRKITAVEPESCCNKLNHDSSPVQPSLPRFYFPLNNQSSSWNGRSSTRNNSVFYFGETKNELEGLSTTFKSFAPVNNTYDAPKKDITYNFSSVKRKSEGISLLKVNQEENIFINPARVFAVNQIQERKDHDYLNPINIVNPSQVQNTHDTKLNFVNNNSVTNIIKLVEPQSINIAPESFIKKTMDSGDLAQVNKATKSREEVLAEREAKKAAKLAAKNKHKTKTVESKVNVQTSNVEPVMKQRTVPDGANVDPIKKQVTVADGPKIDPVRSQRDVVDGANVDPVISRRTVVDGANIGHIRNHRTVVDGANVNPIRSRRTVVDCAIDLPNNAIIDGEFRPEKSIDCVDGEIIADKYCFSSSFKSADPLQQVVEKVKILTLTSKTEEKDKQEKIESTVEANKYDSVTIQTTDSNKKEVNKDNKNTELGKEVTENSKSKAELRAERRAKQEAQRAAKASAKQEPLKKSPQIASEVKPKVEVQKKAAPIVVKSATQHKAKLFSHLFQAKKSNLALYQKLNPGDIHPAIVRLGSQYASRVVNGSNARCVALLSALKQVICDYKTPAEKEFSRGLESQLTPLTDYLNHCRPLSVSMTNALRHIKWHLTQLPNDVSDLQAQKKLCDIVDTYIREQIDVAGEAICNSVQKKIANGDVILTYGCSSLIYRILVESHRSGTKFRVVVVDAGPWLEGREMLRRLVDKGLQCSYVLISATSFIMREVSKVLLGAHALLANGYVMSRAGSSQVALLAHSFNVPVLVCCETHKFSERVQTDAFVYNELGDPEEFVPKEKWANHTNLTPLTLAYDVTPPELVTAVVTELAILPCTSVPVILRLKPSESHM